MNMKLRRHGQFAIKFILDPFKLKGRQASEPTNPVSEESKDGSVMVLGGGIGGIHVALDLGEPSFKVYVVDNSSAIGGVIAHSQFLKGNVLRAGSGG